LSRRLPTAVASLALVPLLALAALTPIQPTRAQETPAAPASASTAPALPKETRGVWVVRTDLTGPAAVAGVVEHARKNGLNTLFVQCRGRGDAYYAGGLEPRAQSLEKRAAPEFDPLALTVEQGHAAGLKVHAWVNACYVWSESKAPVAPEHLVNAHPDWLAVDRTGRRRRVGDPEVFVCPGNPEARAHLADVCRDLAARYELDGVQLDYIRYADEKLCYCGGCLERFQEYLAEHSPARVGGVPANATRAQRVALVQRNAWSWSQFRREQVTSLVREIRDAVKGARPAALLSAAVVAWGPFPGDFNRSEAYVRTGQDWYGWIRLGLVDAVAPMTYQTGQAGFKSWINSVARHHRDFPVWFGIGAYLFGPESAAAKIQTVRQAGGQGWVLFSYTSVTRSGKDDAYLRSLKARVLSRQSATAR